jgi:hypothetical protein
MASSASDPLSILIIPETQGFSWNPPQLNPFPLTDKKMSTKTRPESLAFFDKHFSKELKLLRVECLPSLVHDITAIVDKSIIDYFNDGLQFPPESKFYSAEDIDRAVENLDKDMEDEEAVANFMTKLLPHSAHP